MRLRFEQSQGIWGGTLSAVQESLQLDVPLDVGQLKRELRAIHSLLRDQGRNPLESVRDMAVLLAERGESAKSLLGRCDEAPSDLLAQAFQTIINDDLRSSFGQYLTPPPVSQHVAALVGSYAYKPSSFLDPFGGSGALLHDAAMVAPGASLALIEINQLAADVARSLAGLSGKPIEIIPGDAFALWRNRGVPNVDVVVMNPPFGAGLSTEVVRSCVDSSQLPSLRSMGRVPVELLAMELASAAASQVVIAVLPLSVLTNRGYAAFRSEFFAVNQLVHVSSLPAETFAPYRGVAQSCVCVWKPNGERSRQFAVRRSLCVGYDATGRPTGVNDLSGPTPHGKGVIDPEGCVLLHLPDTKSSGGSRRLGDIASVFRGKNPPNSAYKASDATGYLLKVGSLSGTMLSWPVRKRSRVSQAWIRAQGERGCRLGDICLTAAAHTPKYIGLKVDLVDHLPEDGAITSAELLTIRLNDDSGVKPAALLMYLRSVVGYEQLQSIIRGSTAHLYPDDLANIVIPDLNELLDQSAVDDAFLAAASAHREWLRVASVLAATANLPSAAASLLEDS